LYCLLTVVLLFIFYPQLTIFDVFYFMGELLIILSLASLEMKAAVLHKR
jgi:hypothetical protein